MLQFEWPLFFILLPLPIAAYFLLPAAERQDTALRVPFFSDLKRLSRRSSMRNIRQPGALVLLTMIWLLTLCAAAGPKWTGDPVRLPTTGRDLLLAVDLSGSMETADMVLNGEQVNRLIAIKSVVGDFVRRRENDRLGLILFGTQAYLQAPLTFDRNTVYTLLQEARLGFAGERTAIGDAIGLATKRLMDRPQGHRVLILLTDGANTDGAIDPVHAADLANQAGVRIYTIGMGADEMILPGIFTSGFGARRVNPSADLDEDSLIAIANKTGGQYFRARNVEELEGIYTELDRLEPIELDAESFRPTISLFHWPLGLALLLSLMAAAYKLWSERLATSTREASSG